ncbi:MAG: Hsp20 family protein [Alphaproteobacteria bacterium]|nr:Hsp20 family protein [Alphaproteobacteria bacterium]
MRNQNLDPFFRSSIGFDRMARLLNEASRAANQTPNSYPPYNIEKLAEDDYQLTMAVAGFGDGDLDISVENGSLVVKGAIEDKDEGREFLHRGIAARAFERRFDLAEHIEVEGAKLENGLLHINLRRVVPDAKKPRKIAISATKAATIEHHRDAA